MQRAEFFDRAMRSMFRADSAFKIWAIDEFDYVRFMKIKVLPDPGMFRLTNGKNRKRFSRFTILSAKFTSQLNFYKSFGLNPDEYVFITALPWELYKSNLSNDFAVVRQQVHVLAVSGLHVGIIYLILNVFFLS